jgi:hypothetical protein
MTMISDAGTAEAQTNVIAVDFSNRPSIDYAMLEFDLGQMRKRLAIWEIFLGYAKDGARTWNDVRNAITPADLDEISRICDGTSLEDLLLGGN